MQEIEQAIQLKRMRRLATGLLVLMAVVFVVSRLLEPRWGYLSFVTAFAEAAMVGALADWFAVTALFRAPLGLPIPHTAIIPRNKERIGENLAHFLEHNFITQEIIRDELRAIDFAGAAATWLSRSENSIGISRQIIRGIPALLRIVEDDDVREFMQSRISSSVEGVKFAPLIAELLQILTVSDRHQEVFNRLIDLAATALNQNKPYIRWKIHEASPRWLPKKVDDKLYERLIDAVQSTLEEMRDDDSEWRLRYHKAFVSFIEKLRASPEYEERIAHVAKEILAQPVFRDYIVHIWHGMKEQLAADAASTDSRMIAKLDEMLRGVSRDLLGDTHIRNKLNQGIQIGRAHV